MAQQSLSQITDAIATINGEVFGIKASYNSTNLPATIAIWPCTVVLLGMDDWTKFGATDFLIRCFVAPAAQPGNVGSVYSQLLTLSERFHQKYSTWKGPIGDRVIDRTALKTKAGFGNTGFTYTLKWGSTDWYGFQIVLPLMSGIPGN